MNPFPVTVPHSNDQIDRVRRNTASECNERIDRQIEHNLLFYSTQPAETISHRIRELEEEWDIERFLEVNASALALGGVALGLLRGRSWLTLSATVMGFLFLHGVQGWCPPLPMLRRLGVRTREEIDREKFGLMQLRIESIGASMAPPTAPGGQ
jgi:hypothetical protein